MRSFLKIKVDGYSKTKWLTIGALFSTITVILQSAGIFAGIGFLLSMMSTGPLVLATLLSLRMGVMTYFATIFLLAVLQPSELLIFSFTTGLLGLSLGAGLKLLRKSIFVVLFAALSLTLGISILLYGLKFPILGPAITSYDNGIIMLGVFIFCFLYSWIWMILSIYVFGSVNSKPKKTPT